MEQTTSQQLQPLLDELQDLRARNEAFNRRIKFLEWRLEQRIEETKKDYKKLKKYFDIQKGKIMDIFINDPVRGMTHDEIISEFKAKYPMINIANIPRRVRELVEEGRLWSCPDDNGIINFHLKLKGGIESEGETYTS